MIFSLVVGHQFIHLMYVDNPEEFWRTVCTVAVSEDEVYKQFVTGYPHIRSNKPVQHRSTAFRERHSHCISSWPIKRGDSVHGPLLRSWPAPLAAQEPPKPRLHLSLLGVCRQIYAEANTIFWTTNTYSFQDIATLRVFMNGLHSTQKRSLRGCTSTLGGPPSMQRNTQRHSVSPSSLNSMECEYLMLPSIRNISVCRDKDILIFWHRMRALPLRHVTVVVPDTAIPWSVGRRNTAEDLRSLLLGPNGPEVLGIVKEMREAEDEGFEERYQAVKAARRALPESIVRS